MTFLLYCDVSTMQRGSGSPFSPPFLCVVDLIASSSLHTSTPGHVIPCPTLTWCVVHVHALLDEMELMDGRMDHRYKMVLFPLFSLPFVWDMGHGTLQFHHDKHHAAYVANANKVFCCCHRGLFWCCSSSCLHLSHSPIFRV